MQRVRYDIRGKKYPASSDKYFLSDHAFRYAKPGTGNMDYGRMIENIESQKKQGMEHMIRNATKEDASRLAEILIFAKRMAYGNIFNDYEVSFGKMQVLPLALEFIGKPETLKNIYVLEDEVIKGLIKISYDKGREYFEINELYVDPFFQKQGIGSRLIKYAEETASSSGFTNMILWVLEKNQNARSFYTKHGFTFTSDKKPEDGTAEYIMKYQKKL